MAMPIMVNIIPSLEENCLGADVVDVALFINSSCNIGGPLFDRNQEFMLELLNLRIDGHFQYFQ
jgi:hypothetical protein